MTLYKYSLTEEIDSEAMVDVFDDQGNVVVRFQRYYSNRLKKLMDRNFDFRYFVEYHVYNIQEECLFTIKKIARKGRIHFRANDLVQNRNYMIAYDGWQVMIPDLIITDGSFKMKLEKEMEDWSVFSIENREVARWRATYIENKFLLELELMEETPVQPLAFYVGIAQATLFIGA